MNEELCKQMVKAAYYAARCSGLVGKTTEEGDKEAEEYADLAAKLLRQSAELENKKENE